MHPNVRFLSEYQSIIIRLTGKASFQQMALYLRSLIRYPHWEPGSSILLDCRQLSVRHLTTSVIFDIADLFKINGPQLGDGLWAFVMKNTVGYGLARMWQELTTEEVNFSSRIFTTVREALEWLNLPEEVYRDVE